MEIEGVETTYLSAPELQELEALEEVVADGLATFVRVGKALMAIRDRRLYRAHYRTFEAYCQERWGLGRSYAYELIDAAMVVDNLEMSGIPDILPANPAQVRPLTALPAEQQRPAWERAVASAADGRVTAGHVAAAVREVKAETKAALSPEPAKKDQTVAELAATLAKVARDMSDEPSAAIMLNDLVEEREGWYHGLVLCYVPADVDRRLLAQAARQVKAELPPTVDEMVAATEAEYRETAATAPTVAEMPSATETAYPEIVVRPVEELPPATRAMLALNQEPVGSPEWEAALTEGPEHVLRRAAEMLERIDLHERAGLIRAALRQRRQGGRPGLARAAAALPPATLDELPPIEAPTAELPSPDLTDAERTDRRHTYAWLRMIYGEARDALRMYEETTGDFGSRGPLLRTLEPMIATLDRHLAVFASGEEEMAAG